VKSRPDTFARNVFINCPFDRDYLSLLQPLLFTIIHLGFNPRMASESSDSGEIRLQKICALVRECQYSIHDLSRLRASEAGELSRMNMPFELGVDYGCRRFGAPKLRQKKSLVLEKDQYEFQKAISDLSGTDIKHHSNEPSEMVQAVRHWFVETVGLRNVPSAGNIWFAFNDFESEFRDARLAEGYSEEDRETMPVPEYVDFIRGWKNVPRFARFLIAWYLMERALVNAANRALFLSERVGSLPEAVERLEIRGELQPVDVHQIKELRKLLDRLRLGQPDSAASLTPEVIKRVLEIAGRFGHDGRLEG
jgi:hypothetical protein